jgi:GMP synthase-like glutamine amidotransferase
MNIHYLQHVPFEDPAFILTWLGEKSYPVSATHLYRGEDLPPPETLDGLVIMGGPMSVNDGADHAWLEPEKRFIREVIDAGKPVLGICLGAQLIAAAHGCRVSPGRFKEIGWFPVRNTADPGAEDLPEVIRAFPRRFDAFHWHGETFELPRNCRPFLSTTACSAQGFVCGPGNNVLGLQFHLETTLASARRLAENCPRDLTPGPYIQRPGQFLAEPELFSRSNKIMERVLEARFRPE